MKQYIDKDVLVAEIERRIKSILELIHPNGYDKAALQLYKGLLSFTNTIEVKEVQEEPVSEELEDAAFDYAEACKYEDGEKLLCIEHFKAGAQWQKEHLLAGVDVEAMINESRKNLPRILPKEAIEDILDIYKEGILDTLKVIKGEITL